MLSILHLIHKPEGYNESMGLVNDDCQTFYVMHDLNEIYYRW